MSFKRLSAIHALYGIALGLLMPFLVPLVTQRGLGAAQLGFVLGAAGVAALLAYPLWGAIADGWLGRPRTIVLAALVAAAGGLWILFAGSDPLALTLALSVATVGALPWGPLIDGLTLGVLGDGSAAYGRIRLWASAGWAGSAAVGGLVWMLAGAEAVFSIFVVGALLLAVLASLPTKADFRVRRAGAAAGPSLRSWLPHLLAPTMLGFMAGLLLTSMGEHASWRFISLRILDGGGDVFIVGLAAALPALVEIPVFASSRGLTTRLGLRSMFVLGALVAAVLMAVVAVVPDPWMVTGLRSIEGASYALRYMAMVMIVGLLLPRHLFAMGQSLAWFVYAGIAPILADAAGGVIYESLGAPVLFAVVSGTLALGGAVVWLVLRDPRFGPQREPELEVVAPPPPA